MSRIYHNAANVCVWLGMDSPGSKMAMQFIKEELCDIERFDKIHENTGTADKLMALLQLLERQWFSRRWIIQEIVFARRATLHCGRDELHWSQFATAIELLLEAETASQRFSSMTKVRSDFWDGSSLFEHVNQSGAGLLVQGILFRDYKTQSGSQGPLWGIEHLVSSLTVVFDASEPRDCIYALLGVANDVMATPDVKDEPRLLRPWLLPAMQPKTARYPVDYAKPYPEICMDFIEFCIGQSGNPHRALDIICRPWALEPLRKNLSTGEIDVASEFLPSWVIKASETSFKIMTHTLARKKVTRQNADSLVAPPDAARTQYAASSNENFDRSKLAFKRRPNLRHYSIFVQGFIFDRVERVEASSQDGCIPREWADLAGWTDLETPPPEAFGGRWSTIQGGIQTGAVNTSMLISNDQNSIISQFCKRVQASILNRRLIKTERGRLGLASKNVATGDLLCIFPGCSVPVALRRFSKKFGDDEAEEKEDSLQRSLGVFKRALLNRLRARQMKEQWAKQSEDYKRFIRTLDIPGWNKTDEGRVMKRKPDKQPAERPHSASEKAENAEDRRHAGQEQNEPEAGKAPAPTLGPYYNFLGECYVHGMMDGQATEERRKRSIPYEVFEIR
ncbi:HET-domain-containing protein [Phialemonium atrogriseum]|uniref:HET-domain-containing protein n=1 Tax=Phialemonium atrogriseum TaxID=1093897 RepID=A0AAJ0FI89_9PEZI|nr:HET-domain-containing protein [Phialemonium atrogriseum]KAK1761865.1 HET-domain-containing protein [Phialemonium atrogriseum]